MAEALGEVAVRITADTRPLEQSLKNLRGQAERFAGDTGRLERATQGFNRQLAQTATGASAAASGFAKMAQTALPLQQHFANVTASLSGMVKGFAALATAQAALSLVKAFAEQERQINLLSAQFKLLGVDSKAAMAELSAFNDELQRTTGLDDDVIRSAESIGLRFGLLGKDLQQVTKLAANFAVIAGQDLPQAMLTISRIADEPVQAMARLKRVLPIDAETERLVKAFDKVGDRSSAANTLLNALRRQLEGLAESTDTGVTKSIRDFNNALDNLGKTLAGSFVGPRMVAFIDEFNRRIETTGKEITRIVDALQGLEDWWSGTSRAPVKLFADQPETVEDLAAALEKIHQTRLAEHPIKLTLPPSENVDALKDAKDAAADYANALERATFARDTLFLSPAAKAAADAAHDAFGPAWQQHLDDSVASLARLNEQLSQSYDLTRDFAGTFVHGILEGKTAVDSLSDALSSLESKLIDMALDAVIKGLFAGLTGGAGGGNIFSSLLGGGNASGGVFATGGVVGSTPVPSLRKHGAKLAYDEFPAILHVGETVIPAGGQPPRMSGEQMLHMFGGVPKFEGGWQSMLGAGSSGGAGMVWTPGGTLGGGQSVGSNIGGTLSYPASAPGLGSGHASSFVPSGSAGGGSRVFTRVAVPASVAPLRGLPISPPDIREPIIGIPLPPVLSNYGMPSDLTPFGEDWERMWETTPVVPRQDTELEETMAPTRPYRYTVGGQAGGPAPPLNIGGSVTTGAGFGISASFRLREQPLDQLNLYPYMTGGDTGTGGAQATLPLQLLQTGRGSSDTGGLGRQPYIDTSHQWSSVQREMGLPDNYPFQNQPRTTYPFTGLPATTYPFQNQPQTTYPFQNQPQTTYPFQNQPRTTYPFTGLPGLSKDFGGTVHTGAGFGVIGAFRFGHAFDPASFVPSDILRGSRYDAGPGSDFVPEGPNLDPYAPGGPLWTPTRETTPYRPTMPSAVKEHPYSGLPYVDVGGVQMMLDAAAAAHAAAQEFSHRAQRALGFHSGGTVGSTPAPLRMVDTSIFFRAPRLHSGLAADEYPAILQAGERVVPRGGDGGSKVTVIVNNNTSAQVTTRESDDGSGGIKLDIIIDQLVANKMRDGGSQISRTLQTMGTRATPVRR